MIPEAQAVHVPFQIRSEKPYPVRAMLGFGLNHRLWPGSDFMAEGLQKLEFLGVVDLFMTDTARLADLVLPACTSFERSELKMYSEKHVIWTTPAIEPLGESRSDNEILCDLAKRLTPDDNLMTRGHEACIDWILEPTGLTVKELAQYPAGYTIKNVQMPSYRKYEKDGFPTPSGKMELTSTVLEELGIDPLPRFHEPKLSPRDPLKETENYPLILTTGARLPMFIHSRTFRLPWTNSLRPDPMADMHPTDADMRGIEQGDWIELYTKRGGLNVRANLTEIVPPGVVNMYHGYPEADVNTIIEPDYLDPISGYPGFKSLLCEIKKKA
jgi:anaerobic selenocysteine-containing dehydrogenase